MRADRLVATLLLLQAKDGITAREVAGELEVSTRTARRDLEALAMAGLPVYSKAGRGGGWYLLGGSRTDLTGLATPEATALFLALGAGRHNRSDSGATQTELDKAVRKLLGALPEPMRREAEAASGAVVVDPARWGGPRFSPDEDPEFFDLLQGAVIQRAEVELGYTSWSSGSTLRLVDPLGLVTKSARWYLVTSTEDGTRTFRLDRVDSVSLTGRMVTRPDGFDLKTAWDEITVRYDEEVSVARGAAVAEGWAVNALWGMGVRIDSDELLADGRHRLSIAGPTPRFLAVQLAGVAEGLEVEGPPELVTELAEIGRILVERYR